MGHPKPCVTNSKIVPLVGGEISVHPKLTVKKNMFFQTTISKNTLNRWKQFHQSHHILSYPIISHHFPSFHINSHHFLSCPIISHILGTFPQQKQQKLGPKHCRTCRGDQYSDIVNPGSVSNVTVSLAIWSAWNCLMGDFINGWKHWTMVLFVAFVLNTDTLNHHVSIVFITDSLNYIVFSMCLYLFHKQVE